MKRRFDRRTFAPVALALLSGAGAAGAASFLPAYSMGPPPGHTGGFGEPTCIVCHSDSIEDGARVTLDVPASWKPGSSQTLTIEVEKEGVRRAGFQLAVRFEDGRQAGSLEPLDERTQVTADSTKGVLYIMHTSAGTRVPEPGTVTWSFRWTAPDSAAPVIFHFAANATNDDDSEFGDEIVSGLLRSTPTR